MIDEEPSTCSASISELTLRSELWEAKFFSDDISNLNRLFRFPMFVRLWIGVMVSSVLASNI